MFVHLKLHCMKYNNEFDLPKNNGLDKLDGNRLTRQKLLKSLV
jgi:hypothetical protein